MKKAARSAYAPGCDACWLLQEKPPLSASSFSVEELGAPEDPGLLFMLSLWISICSMMISL